VFIPDKPGTEYQPVATENGSQERSNQLSLSANQAEQASAAWDG